MRRYDAWLVDLDGTLYHAQPLKVVMAAQVAMAGPRAIRVISRFRREHEVLRASLHECETTPFEEQIVRTSRALGLEQGQVRTMVEHLMIERPLSLLRRFKRGKLLHEIATFREEGGRTALVSDYPAKAKLEALGVANLFDQVIVCGEPGGPKRLKPAPDGFVLAATALGVDPSACLVVGDRQDADGAAAEAAGMKFRRVR